MMHYEILIYKHLKVDTAKSILPMMLYISCPCLTPDIDNDPIHWPHELDEDERSAISLLVKIRVVDGGESLIR